MDDPLTLKVPNPETGDRNHWKIVALLAFIAVMVVFAAHLAGLGLGVTGVLGGVVLGLVLLVTLAYFAPAPLTLRRVGPRIEGLETGALPARAGRVVVRRYEDMMQADLPMFVYEVIHEGPARNTQLVRHAPRVSRVRAFAEGLCRIGGYEMVWRDPEGDEIRAPGELDTPLVDRLRAGLDGDDGHLQAEPVPTRPVAGGGVEVSSRPLGAAMFLLVILVPVIVVGAVALVSHDNGWKLDPKTLALGAGVVLAIAATMFLVDRLVTQPIVVTPEAVRLVWRVAGATLRDRRLDPARLESLYLEADRAGTWHLVFAGDGIHRAAGRYPRLGEAVAARRAIIDGLLGRFPEGRG